MVSVNPWLSPLLTNLGEVCRARALAVWVPLEDGLELVGDWHLDQRLYDLLRRRWEASLAVLRAGRRVTLEAEVEMLPLLALDGALLGVVQYVGLLPDGGARRVFLEEALTRFATLLANPLPASVEAEGLLALVPFDLEGDAEEVERRTYAELLERCGWDVTLAAHVLGMTRQALYDRMEELCLVRPTARLRPRGSEG